ncbi:hypothetical protein [Halorhodospira halophila]|uniref:Uncharacterized protein n=1 Tax=Halorhodospira halophila (strain DSM 244 / SL1) TaxID=349124 RepID=A1WW71_HALHL|nr:hypothetical protein [Halorhodospira halophila]ABM61933.1 conserved hypothetical protein [Halorhodospira halophila SL1]MBK1729739.1 hypothetical protein [Halorhodospira halophila]
MKTIEESAKVSVITATGPSRLTESFSISGQNIENDPGQPLVRGFYQQRTCATPSELADLINSLKPNQALAYGLSTVERSPITSRKSRQSNDISVTREFFDWPAAPGWLLIVHHPPRGHERAVSRSDLLSVLREAWPGIDSAPMVFADGSTSWIYSQDTGECLIAQRGLRCYVLVSDARDIPRAGKVLHQRLWLTGHGFYHVSKAGSLDEKSAVDPTVWRPEYLDKVAGAHCEPPLEQRRRPAETRNTYAEPLSTVTTLPDLTETERKHAESIKQDERIQKHAEQEQAKRNWVEEQVASTKPEHQRAHRLKLLDAVENKRLHGGFVLKHSSGTHVTVAKLLENPERWHGERFADPLEPGCEGNSRVAWANLYSGGRPYIYSHAHGGSHFILLWASKALTVECGESPQLLQEVDKLIRQAGVVFQRGGQLVRVIDDKEIHHVELPWLRTHMEEIASWKRYNEKKKKLVVIDSPADLAKRYLAYRGEWSVPELQGIIRGPILRPDGSLLDTPGYDRQTGLLLTADNPERWPRIPKNPDHSDVRAAVEKLWEPFAHFPFVGDVSRGIQLAALLTAVQRPVLNTAPAFAWNAYRAGTGKSKAAKATSWLGGSCAEESPWSEQTEEQRKRLMSALMAGPSTILLDNISGPLESDTLCAILTACRFRDRKLGASEEVTVPTNVLITATGNNLRVVGDLSRRILVATIDHAVENPERLNFPFDPVARIQERWLHYRAAALTVLRGFISAGAPALGKGLMGSYEQWDAQIRRCIMWLKHEGLTRFGVEDPAAGIQKNYEADPETVLLRALVNIWYERYDDRPVRVADLISDAHDGIPGAAPSENRGALLEALQEIAGEPERINRRRLGRWIERHAGRVIDGLRIEEAGSWRSRRQWRVQPVP